MERISISLEADLASQFDALIESLGYRTRSEAVRDLIRERLERDHVIRRMGEYCIANLSYVYNHHERDLAERLTAIQHAHHDLTVSTLHAHLDHDSCIESVILRGPTAAVRQFADAVIAERGVRHGKVNLIEAAVHGTHSHGPGHTHTHSHSAAGDAEPHPHVHVHLKPAR